MTLGPSPRTMASFLRLPGIAVCPWRRPPRHAPQGTFCSSRMMRRSPGRSEEHTSELQSLMRISYAVFCLKKKKKTEKRNGKPENNKDTQNQKKYRSQQTKRPPKQRHY